MKNIKIGILGSGQLAQMLAEAGQKMGVDVHVLTEHLKTPAAQVCKNLILGNVQTKLSARELFSKAKVVVFENEFLDQDLLRAVSRGSKAAFVPSLETISHVRDKGRQKKVLERLSIPTAEWDSLDENGALEGWAGGMFSRFSGGCVFKWAQQGYDGKGVFVTDSDPKDKPAAVEFCREALNRGISVLCEKLIRFKRELALIACYSTVGEFAVYPLVVSEQWKGICRRVYGPATALGVDSTIEKLAFDYAKRLAEAVGLFGCFALELFETSSGELLMNEIAPRVHNSGHYTQDAATTSQFENHLRAVLGRPLGKTDTSPAFAMLNLLGPEELRLSLSDARLPAPPPDLRLHWYGKEDIQPHRKLGHINGTVDSSDQLPDLLERMENYAQKWSDYLVSKEGNT